MCHGCGVAAQWVERPAAGAWARFSGSFRCTHCTQSSPLLAVPLDGRARCLHCQRESPFDVGALREVLADGHASVDVALGRVPATFQHPTTDILGEAYREVVGEHVLRLLPGVPVCARCHGALVFAREGDTDLARCVGCSDVGRYRVVEGRTTSALSTVLGDEHRTEPPALVAPSAAALSCPSCGGPLPERGSSHTVTCTFCGTASRLPLRVLVEHREQDPLWVRFRGDSEVLETYLRMQREAATHPPQAEVAPTPSFVDRHFAALFMGAVLIVGALAALAGAWSGQ